MTIGTLSVVHRDDSEVAQAGAERFAMFVMMSTLPIPAFARRPQILKADRIVAKAMQMGVVDTSDNISMHQRHF